MSDTQYIVSARKYRPATFKSVVGQKNLTETLKNAIDSKRLAQAYLFCGPRGVGKTSCARIFAKTINCLNPTPDGEACGHCESCLAIEEGNSFNIVELDAASNNSVDDIRNLTEQVNVPPTIGKYRVFIIDEVHMLSSQAFNAFLKTLEEPPSYVVFILATTEKHKVIPTILSRCQIYDFKRITIQDMVEHLQYVASQEGIETDVPSLNVIAKKADGAMRDALSIFDQVAASSFGKITYDSTIEALNVLDYEFYFRLVDAFRAGDVPEALMIYKEIRDRGFDSLLFVNGLAAHIRDLMVAYSPKTASLLEVADDVAKQYNEQARTLPIDWHYTAMRILNDCDAAYRTSSNKQLLVELTLIRLCQLLNPPTPPFDRVDKDKIPLQAPSTRPALTTTNQPVKTVPQPSESTALPPSGTKPETQHANDEAQQKDSHNPNPDSSQVAHTVSEETAKQSEKTSETERHGKTVTEKDSPEQPRTTVRGRRKNVTQQNNPTTTPDDVGQFERQRQPVDINGFLKAWHDYMSRNLEKHILVSAMRKTTPEQTDAETFKVIVDHPAQRQAFEASMTDLIGFLRKAIHNDFVTLNVEVDTSKQQDKNLPPQELLREMIEANPLIAQLIADIDGEID